jgi:hypothetical protein
MGFSIKVFYFRGWGYISKILHDKGWFLATQKELNGN